MGDPGNAGERFFTIERDDGLRRVQGVHNFGVRILGEINEGKIERGIYTDSHW